MDFIFKFLPIIDYIKTRRKLWKQYIVPIFACVITLSCSFIMDIKAGIDIEKVFSDFVNVQILYVDGGIQAYIGKQPS